MSGLFITFEGGEGGGKSTQAATLAKRLRGAGVEVLTTREPGGTDMAERIRALLVTGEPEALSSTAEALLNYAARDDHLRRLIRPALAAGRVVICDRFMDSSRAYQGYAGDCPISLLDALERDVVGGTMPDLTIILDIDPATALRRKAAQFDDARAAEEEREDRFERKGLEYLRRVREAFLRIAREHPERCVIIDAARPPEAVAVDVWRAVAPLLEKARA